MNTKLQRVWLVLAEVQVVDENPAGLSVGSGAVVQCFIPETEIEVALIRTDQLLLDEGMRLVGVRSRSHFDHPADESGAPDFVKHDVQEARTSLKALTGTFFVSKDTASFDTGEG
jgi:hypothetical protein